MTCFHNAGTAVIGCKGPFKWTNEMQLSFDAMKALIAHDVMLHYPNHSKPFHMYTDTSNLQLGAVTMQDDPPVAFYSRKLSTAQWNYITSEKELLSIVETLREFKPMLFGCKELHIHTDHHNLTHTNLNSERMLCWHLFLEEF
jgi:RNase H-like domain found in reverse transcriptase